MTVHSQESFAEQFLRYQCRVYAYIATLLPNRDDAEDVFQQTSMILWRKWSQFDPERDFVRWACGIAHNEVRNFLRRPDRMKVALSDDVLELLSTTQLAEESMAEDRLNAMRKCLDELPPRHIQLVENCYASDQPARNVAEQLGIAPATLYVKLHRIRRVLLECIERRLTPEAGS